MTKYNYLVSEMTDLTLQNNSNLSCLIRMRKSRLNRRSCRLSVSSPSTTRVVLLPPSPGKKVIFLVSLQMRICENSDHPKFCFLEYWTKFLQKKIHLFILKYGTIPRRWCTARVFFVTKSINAMFICFFLGPGTDSDEETDMGNNLLDCLVQGC